MVVNLLTRCDENSAASNKMGASGQANETENRRVKGEIFSLVARRSTSTPTCSTPPGRGKLENVQENAQQPPLLGVREAS